MFDNSFNDTTVFIYTEISRFYIKIRKISKIGYKIHKVYKHSRYTNKISISNKW